MGSADFQKASKNHVAWYHVQWFHRFHEKKCWNSTRLIHVLDRRVWQAPQCGRQVQTYFKHKNLLVTTDFALVKVFNSNILSLEFASHAYRGNGHRICCQPFHLVQRSQVWKPDGANVLRNWVRQAEDWQTVNTTNMFKHVWKKMLDQWNSR